MPDKITPLLKAIADPTRREIFNVLLLATSALPITVLAGQFDISRQGVTKHINVLKDAGLIKMEKHGRESYCVADALPLKEVQKWLTTYEQFWNNSLDNLGTFLEGK